ncbi:MAG TPA: radical SAM protein [Myxococcota bacterium]|nr:radical SAM protein [Myxococcota bacterium]
MKVALVFPRLAYRSGDPPLGVALLAGQLERLPGVQVDILDTTFESDPYEYLLQAFERGRYDLIGVSVMASMMSAASRVVAMARSACPQATIVLGGPHPTVIPEQTLLVTGADAVCIGEADATLPEIVRQPGNLTHIAGVAFLRNGKLTKTAPRKPIEDLDALPLPAWHLLPMRAYLRNWFQMDAVPGANPGTSIIASRGCSFNCSYCQPTLRRLFGSTVRKRSPENIAAEISRLVSNYAIRGFMIQDDTFTIDPDWAIAAGRAIHNARPEVIWACNARADTLDEKLISELWRCGLRKVNIGIESASERILREVYNKRISPRQIRSAVNLAKQFGLSIQGYFMLGAPGESEDEVRQTIRLARELPLDDATFSITTPLPGTILYKKTRGLIRPGIVDFDYYGKPVYREDAAITPDLLNRLRREAYLGFYLSPKRLRTIIRHLFLSGRPEKTINKLRRLL